MTRGAVARAQLPLAMSIVQDSDESRIQGVVRRHDLEAFFLDEFLEDRLRFTELARYTASVGQYAVVDLIAGKVAGFFYRGLNRGNQIFEMSCFGGALYRGCDSAAFLVPEDHNQLGVQVFGGIFDTAEFIVGGYVSDHANHK